MHYTSKIPFMLGAIMTIIIGIISFYKSVEPQQIYLRMILSLVSFFLLGVIIKSTIEKIQSELQEKYEKEKAEAEAAAEAEAEQSIIEGEGVIYERDKQDAFSLESHLEGDSDEDFSPLKVSEIITTKAENNI